MSAGGVATTSGIPSPATAASPEVVTSPVTGGPEMARAATDLSMDLPTDLPGDLSGSLPVGLPADVADLEGWFADRLTGLPPAEVADALARAEELACTAFAPRDVVAAIRRALSVEPVSG